MHSVHSRAAEFELDCARPSSMKRRGEIHHNRPFQFVCPWMESWLLHLFKKKGTRQGSGLSPCIFTMPVDFAMKVADLACEELGMVGTEDEDKRGAYADDVAERTRNEEEASVSLQQFETWGGVWRLRVECGEH